MLNAKQTQIKGNEVQVSPEWSYILDKARGAKSVLMTLDFSEEVVWKSTDKYNILVKKLGYTKELETAFIEEGNTPYDKEDDPYYKPYEFYQVGSEFADYIYQKQYKKKTAYRWWKKHTDDVAEFSVFNYMRSELQRPLIKLKLGKNSWIIVTSGTGYYLTDRLLINMVQVMDKHKKVGKRWNICPHSPFLDKVMGYSSCIGDIPISYTAYKNPPKPLIFGEFAQEEEHLRWEVAPIKCYIRPIGYYTFHTKQKTPTNIETIYYDTEVKHTNKDFIIYELYDELKEYTKEELRNAKRVYEDTNKTNMYLEANLLRKKKKKEKKYKKKDKYTTELEIVCKEPDGSSYLNKIMKYFESEKVYESDYNPETEQVEEPEPAISPPISEPQIEPISEPQVEEPDPTPEIIFHTHDDNIIIKKMIDEAIAKQSSFFQLVQPYAKLHVVKGIHNSFHKTEKHNHFTIILYDANGVRTPTFHIYLNWFPRIIYYTKVERVYD